MKFPITTIIVTTIIAAVSAVSLFGQEVAITEAEFEKIVSASSKAYSGKTFRQTVVFEEIVSGIVSPDKTWREIYERIPPDRVRQITIKTQNGKDIVSEIILVGAGAWIRTNDGPWARADDSSFTIGGAYGTFVRSENYKSKGKTKLSAVEVSEYEKSVKRSLISAADGSAVEEFVTTTIWIDNYGLRLKAIEETKNLKTGNVLRRTEAIDYNPQNLKIEAPIK